LKKSINQHDSCVIIRLVFSSRAFSDALQLGFFSVFSVVGFAFFEAIGGGGQTFSS
jgi:hypothetical protein